MTQKKKKSLFWSCWSNKKSPSGMDSPAQSKEGEKGSISVDGCLSPASIPHRLPADPIPFLSKEDGSPTSSPACPRRYLRAGEAFPAAGCPG